MKTEIIPDFGFASPLKTKGECTHPEFADKNYHRVAIMKKEHFGAKGDRDPCGLPGWTVKKKCVGCGREFKCEGFYPS